MDEKLRRLIEQAIQMEKDGIEFYQKLAGKIEDLLGRRWSCLLLMMREGT